MEFSAVRRTGKQYCKNVFSPRQIRFMTLNLGYAKSQINANEPDELFNTFAMMA